MRRKIAVMLGALFLMQTASFTVRAQESDDKEVEIVDDNAANPNEDPPRTKITEQRLQERLDEEARVRELDGYREAATVSSEYTLDPSTVELVVEMDPRGYGFRTRDHRMTIAGEFDFLLRGRGMVHYDYRFYDYLSFGVVGGVDWTGLSLYTRFREGGDKPSPKQLAILLGGSAKWRVTEWYMRSSIFLEPSILFGYMWQTLVVSESSHWRLRPGIFGGFETVFDSGLAASVRVGLEFPFDFADPNPVVEIVEPLVVVGLGFAI